MSIGITLILVQRSFNEERLEWTRAELTNNEYIFLMINFRSNKNGLKVKVTKVAQSEEN